jgi:adenine-specific DNA-methyltransferase
VIKYLGSKRLLLPTIVSVAQALPDVRRVLDLFSGTSRVGHALKAAGFDVVSNDHLAYAATLARCYVEADSEKLWAPAEALLTELSAVPPKAGYFTETFCERARFFQPHNGARIDAIRAAIAARDLPPTLEAVVLTSLIEAADRVDSTTGVQMAYLKQWAARAHRPLALRMPAILPGPGRALQLEAEAAAREVEVDLAYLDPPYNQHRYVGNYHVWETLARGDTPEVYGVACKRVDSREVKSGFNSRRGIEDAFRRVLEAVRARHLLVSFSNEGFLDRETLIAMLAPYGAVECVEIDFKRYVGAQIGIHNPKGQKVGEVSHLRNKEYLFVVSPERADAAAAAQVARDGIAARATPRQGRLFT